MTEAPTALLASIRANVGSFVKALPLIRLVRTLPARHSELSVISSLDDIEGQPTTDLLVLALDAARLALEIDLSEIASRCRSTLDARLVQQWPGEHYRLLAALVRVLEPQRVVEIGTATGLGALALLEGGSAKVITYDIVPWSEFADTALRESDFGEQLEQRMGDLAEQSVFDREAAFLSGADVIFIDGPKDGRFEEVLLNRLFSLLEGQSCLLVLDDIRLPNMIELWRRIRTPALDLTSLGHWSGTGLIQIGSSKWPR